MPCPLSPSDRRARHGPTRPSAATIALAFLLLDPVPLAVQVNGQLEETIEPREHASTQHHLGGSAAFPSGAAQTRIVSAARIRLDPRKSVRSFKGIICGDISEFESYMPSQPVPPLRAMCAARQNLYDIPASCKLTDLSCGYPHQWRKLAFALCSKAMAPCCSASLMAA